MKVILLSIKPEYVNRILSGEKKYEYRKRLAKNKSCIILIYSTAPVMKVVAKAEVNGTISAAPSTLWEMTKYNSGISRKKYREYFQNCKTAYAYKFGKIIVFDSPLDLSEFNLSIPPQSFAYVDI
ncbi:ASCH domain-containing protein [Phascolarctobacterium sp.]|uniref:ASCH domain-containing protein n=1 Tax=Phascolarctobacterium sp. TaxID=2049039 RepID=UPI0030522CA0